MVLLSLACGSRLLEAAPLSWNLFPVPIFRTTPSEGQTYGLMPVVTASNGDKELKTIIAAAGQFNEISRFSTFGAAYYYPSPGSAFNLYLEAAQKIAREATFEFLVQPKGKGSLIHGGKISFLTYPFERFFGFGPGTVFGNETNFVSKKITASGTVGYQWTRLISTVYSIRVENWKLLPHAIPELNDTLTTFADNPEVINSNNVTHRVEVRYDTHPEPVFSEQGELVQFAYLAALDGLGSDQTFHGYDLNGKITRGFRGGRYVTVAVASLNQRFGAVIPFYLQSSLGGLETLRGYMERRFTARHRFSLDLEERIELIRGRIFDTEVGFSLDPFVSVGQVFDNFSEIEAGHLRPVGGFGVRAKAKPAVVGRLDFGAGGDGIQVHATLNYPF